MRSSAALSALIRLCPTNIHITNFYHRVHNRIGLPNPAVMPTDNDTPEKKCYLFLVALTWALPDLCSRRPGYDNHIKDYSSWKETLLTLISSWR